MRRSGPICAQDGFSENREAATCGEQEARAPLHSRSGPARLWCVSGAVGHALWEGGEVCVS